MQILIFEILLGIAQKIYKQIFVNLIMKKLICIQILLIFILFFNFNILLNTQYTFGIISDQQAEMIEEKVEEKEVKGDIEAEFQKDVEVPSYEPKVDSDDNGSPPEDPPEIPDCDKDQVLQDGECVDGEEVCNNNEVVDDNKCRDAEDVCDSDEVVDDNKCRDAEDVCDSDEVVDDNKCRDAEDVCDVNQIVQNNECVTNVMVSDTLTFNGTTDHNILNETQITETTLTNPNPVTKSPSIVSNNNETTYKPSYMEILNMRLANGEITIDEYLNIKNTIEQQ